MEINQGIQLLTNTFKNQDWFCNVGLDEQHRYVVYVKSMSLKILTTIPSAIEGKQVLVQFAEGKPRFEVLESKPQEYKIPLAMDDDFKAGVIVSVVNEPIDLLEELDRLEEICGKNILSDIFFEIMDQKNAVTNLSSKFPEVRKDLEALYIEYGFDILHDELNF